MSIYFLKKKLESDGTEEEIRDTVLWHFYLEIFCKVLPASIFLVTAFMRYMEI